MTSSLDLGPQHELFDGAWLKWGQAVVHSQSLEADIHAFGNDPNLVHEFTVRTEYQPKRYGFAVFLTSLDPMPVRWGLAIADVANNFRSCLDQVAWAVVTRGKTPPTTLGRNQQRSVGFPISGKREEFNGEISHKLPGARRSDVARIRRYQPYHRSERKQQRHCFRMLSALNNGNKHRTIQPLWAVPMSAAYEVTHQRHCEVPTQFGRAIRGSLEVGMELGFFRAKKRGPNPEVELKATLTVEPFLEHLVMVRQWLYISKGWIFLLLLEFSRPPDELLEIGIDWGALNLDPAVALRPST